jgi:hypothetical protein
MMAKSDLVRRDVCRTESAVAIVVEFNFVCEGCAAKVTTAIRHAGRARNRGLEKLLLRRNRHESNPIEKFGNRTEVVRAVDIAERDMRHQETLLKNSLTIPETFLGVGYTKDRTGLPLEAIRTPLPQPGADQVLIRVAAAVGVSPDDLMITLYEARISHLAGARFSAPTL